MVLYNSCGSQWFLGILSGALQFLVGFVVLGSSRCLLMVLVGFAGSRAFLAIIGGI